MVGYRTHLASTAKTFALVKLSTPNTRPKANVKNPKYVHDPISLGSRQRRPHNRPPVPHTSSMAQRLTAHARQDRRTPDTRQPQRSVHRPVGRKPDDTKRGCQVSRLPRSEFLTRQTEVWLRRDGLELDFRVVVVGMIFPVKVGVGDSRFRA
jgi:hypothetical protein